MENMKRAISAFMALVLVLGMLPGVPMFAGAEEVETQPETQAVETTEAVTVPAETEAPETTEAPVETVPETTAAVETVPEETVPETTAAQETVPQETAPEQTLPGETVPAETVEILEELDASQEEADAYIVNYVKDIQIKASSEYTYVGDKITLSATTNSDATHPEVEFYVVDGDITDYDEELLKKGVLVVESAGTLIIAARATDNGEESHDSASQETGGTVKVTFVDYAMAINRTAQLFEEANVHEYNGDGTKVESLKVMTGKKVELSAHYLVGGEPAAHLPGTTPDIKWYLDEEGEKYASVETKSDCMEAVVTARTVTGTKMVTLYAKEETLGVVDSINIAVYPIPYKVGIYDETGIEGVEYTNDTIIVPITGSLKEEYAAQGYVPLELTAQVWPLEAEEPMTWESSDGLVRIKHPDKETAELAEGTEPEKDTTRATLLVDFREGTSVITVTSKNYPDVVSKVTIERKACLEAKDLDFGHETKLLRDSGDGLIAGKSFQLEVYDIRDKSEPELLTSETVKWSLADGDEAFATISENGKLTARKDITSGAEITVRCEVIGNEEAYLELPVTIRPLATELQILPGDLADDTLEADTVLNGKTVAVDTSEGRKPFKLDFVILPAEDEGGAQQKVTWKSSNTGIAEIEEHTDRIIWKKNGTVTITATAADGSGKKATVKLKFGAQVQNIEIVQDEDFFLRSGKSWTFDVEFTPVNPTEKGLTWSLVGENDTKYASIGASTGKLTAKTVYEEHIVTVRATAKDGSEVYGETQVTIKPKDDGMLVLKSDSSYVSAYENFVTKTTQIIPVGEEITLDAYFLNDTDRKVDVKWKSSSKNAQVSPEIGGSTTVTILNTGTFTITATSLDEPTKKATVTLKGVRMTDSVEWTHTHETTELACGKSLTLKAKAYDAEGKTPSISRLAWSIEQDGNYAKVANGKVTTIAGALGPYDDPVDITVVAAATDGSGETAEWGITIYPIVQSIAIDRPSELYPGTTTFVMENPGEDVISMSAQVWPANALDTVTWKTSSKTIAEIDPETGDLTCKKAGTVTITATANDGSGKKATYKLTIMLKPAFVYFENEHFAIAGGKSLKLKPVLLDGCENKVTGKKLEWKVLPVEGMEDGTPYVTSISGGTLKTRKVTEPKFVKVVLRTQEKYEDWEFEYAELIVGIYPAASSVTIVDADGKDIGKTKWVALSSGGLQLGAVVESKTGDAPYQGVTWKSSNNKIAEFDDLGHLVFHKAGTVTITATAADGNTTVKDSFKLTIGE